MAGCEEIRLCVVGCGMVKKWQGVNKYGLVWVGVKKYGLV